MARILIADDHEPVHRSVREILSEHAGWVVCGEAADGDAAVELTKALRPDIAILDFKMPKMNGLQAAGEILQSLPGQIIVLYTLHGDKHIEAAAKKAGIRCVISKADGIDALIHCIEEQLAAAGDGPPRPATPKKATSAAASSSRSNAKNKATRQKS